MARAKGQLSQSGRRAILWLAEKLRWGYSGEITFICHEGGIRSIQERQVHSPDKLVVPGDGVGKPGQVVE